MIQKEIPNRKKQIYKVTLLGSLANVFLLIFKLIAGYLGHSNAMIADGIHSLSDFITDVVVLLFVNISSMPKDKNHEYGHAKFETLATSFIGAFLLFVAFGLFWNGSTTIYEFLYLGKELQTPGTIALIAAIVSILVKEALFQYTKHIGKKVNSQAAIANAWHHRSDAFSSIGTMIGIGGAILLGYPWQILDPLAAIIVSFLILKVAISQLVESISQLLDKSAPKGTEEEILQIITSNPQITNPHNLFTRYLGNDISIEVHLCINGDMTVKEAHSITLDIEKKLKDRFGNKTHIMLHVDPDNI